jgi:hypothetical protein
MLFNRFEYERNLGLLHGMARAATLLWPVHQGQQYIFSPLAPPWRHRSLRQVLTDRLPPKVDEGRDAGKLLLDFVQGVFLQWQSVSLKQHFDCLELSP